LYQKPGFWQKVENSSKKGSKSPKLYQDGRKSEHPEKKVPQIRHPPFSRWPKQAEISVFLSKKEQYARRESKKNPKKSVKIHPGVRPSSLPALQKDH